MANNPNHLNNLKPFKKGVDDRRNVSGENRKIPAIDVLLAEVLEDPINGTISAKAILLALRDKAIKGDVRAAEVLLERAYGKALQKTDVNLKFGVDSEEEYVD
ncbi:hypothetical protein [Adhaeribacter radiodurans]|uniref:DUF5681 domain-containing protein n=1 Tax=Adhaeribacter radiodurans TaxID=2745197 RepID=A0A7L7LCN8_9BACT|nr:hypothetical protein [Adhaeribacter radiodurans]QMU30139.1 hypothetical protein HUW48_19835 [Adhaeribacter radiodurans]